MDKAELLKKYKPDDDAALEAFVQNGFVLYKDVHNPKLIESIRDWILGKYNILDEKSRKGEIKHDVHGWSVPIIKKLVATGLWDEFSSNPNMIGLMKKYLGPDVCVFDQDALWINVPGDKHPVLNKDLHNETWTGTSVNTLFVWTLFTDVDEMNSMDMAPGSHLLGMIPVRNRNIDPAANIKLETVTLDNLKLGDVVVWHPLTIHRTTGHSSKNLRIAITSRYTSTETHFSSQERALGYKTLSVGPMNQVLRIIGNDYLTPFRTYGGFVGVDRRLRKLYGYSDYQAAEEGVEKYL